MYTISRQTISIILEVENILDRIKDIQDSINRAKRHLNIRVYLMLNYMQVVSYFRKIYR